jgi:hypothetical protein
MTLQQSKTISEIPIKLPKNAKLFKNNYTGLIHLVHYEHVILTLGRLEGKYKVLAAYAGSPTSQRAIEDALHTLEISDRYYCMEYVYKLLGKTKEDLKSDRGDYRASTTGIYQKPRMVKADWSERISELEDYNYKNGAYLWQ